MALWRQSNGSDRELGPAAAKDFSDRLADPARLGRASGSDRPSSGIQGFLRHLNNSSGLHILDLGSLSEETAWLLGGLGHHIHCVSLLRGFDNARRANSREDGTLGAQAANRLIRSHLDYPRNSIHAVLAWDVLQHLDEITRRATIGYLSKIMRPNGIMFCLFHGDESKSAIPVYSCSVTSESTLALSEVGRRKRFQSLSTRKLESLFPQFRAIHFYLKRDALLEVLVFS